MTRHSRSSGSDNKPISTTWSILSGSVPHMAPANRFDNEVFHFYQTVDFPSAFSAGTASNGVYSFAPNLNTILSTQLTALQAIFDQYMIEDCEVWVEAQNQTSTPVGQIGGKLYTVVDYDDLSNLTSVGQALSYSNCVATSFNQGHYRRWKPHVALAAYSGTFTSYANVKSIWIDIASPAVQHYGVKVYTDFTSTSTVTFDIRVRLRIGVRNLR